MTLELLNKTTNELQADILIEFLNAETLETHAKKEALEIQGFSASQDSVCALFESGLIVCGIEDYGDESLRSAATQVINALRKTNFKTAKLSQYYLKNVSALVEGFILGSYRFDAYKSKTDNMNLETLTFAASNFNDDALEFAQLEEAFTSALIISTATNFTRTLVNTTPEDMTPLGLADVAMSIATENALTCEVLDEKELENEGMNAILSVGRASRHESCLIQLSYIPENPIKTISLIGKGLTYDSGGLSLKPAASMVGMKMDKAGACAVLGILKAVSELKLPIEVHGFIGAAENMVDGSAYKPDDVLVAKNGTTIEVRNTDAEGRLVLADTLCYAQEKVQADYLFDYATLTGACMVALGAYTTGMMGHSNHLKHTFLKGSAKSGEMVGSLPFNRHLKKMIKSEVADISNIGNKPYGGAITAALFLDNFITEDMKQKWLHFDIAGPAYTDSPWDCNPFGGTGAGVRMSVKFIQSLSAVK